ncbi:MAG: PAS domain-containing sensor histidine kinase [Halobacteriovoraceae bacterium]|jgi:PAS domain S-box-containing protein|nr:PAS domain-containing sensor histidine kinase [Halobacteriovoraceae bacterium]
MEIYQNIFESNPFPCFIFSLSGDITCSNSSAKSFLLGWNEQSSQLSEKNLKILLYQNNLNLQNIEVYIDEKYYRFEVIKLSKDNYIFYGFNVTFQKTTADTLFNLIDDVHEALILVDVESQGKIVEVNKTASRYLGYSREELLTMSLSDVVENFEITTQEQWMEHAMRVKVTDNAIVNEETFVRKNGTKFSVELVVSIKKIMEKDYQLTLIRDITERVREQKIKEEMKVQMFSSAKLSHLGEMATSVAHEINNPLTIIIAKALNLKKLLLSEKLDVEKSVSAVDAIESTVKRITKVISSLRNISKSLREDSYRNEKAHDILEDVLNIYTERVKILNIKLTLSGLDKLVDQEIYCNRAQIAQAIISVMNNSFDAIAKVENPWIEISCVTNEKEITIAVTDSGTGITPMVLDEMFEPFYSTKRLGKGSGLGLSIAKSTLHKHGGSLEYDRASRNTSFKFTLPIGASSN